MRAAHINTAPMLAPHSGADGGHIRRDELDCIVHAQTCVNATPGLLIYICISRVRSVLSGKQLCRYDIGHFIIDGVTQGI